MFPVFLQVQAPLDVRSVVMQGFDEFFKDIDDWVRNDRLVIGVQLRLVGRPEVGPYVKFPALQLLTFLFFARLVEVLMGFGPWRRIAPTPGRIHLHMDCQAGHCKPAQCSRPDTISPTFTPVVTQFCRAL